MTSGCRESRMKNALCDLQMTIPRCMTRCMDVPCVSRNLPVQ
jgi:hypothetical protein